MISYSLYCSCYLSMRPSFIFNLFLLIQPIQVWAFYELENCQELEEIELCGCIYLSNSALVAISKRCPSLRKINISECPGINGRGILKLISYGNNLVDFVASRCPQAIDDEVVRNFIRSFHKRVVNLDISYCKISEDVAIQISACYNLKCLKLSGCQINDEVIAEYSKVKEDLFSY